MASRVGRLLARAKCSARIVVKVGGMCWVIRIGARSITGPISPTMAVNACGPPVDDPITSAHGDDATTWVDAKLQPGHKFPPSRCVVPMGAPAFRPRGGGAGRADEF